MPRVTIKTGFMGPDGREEELAEYICDATGCSNVASHVLGCVKELGLALSCATSMLPCGRTPRLGRQMSRGAVGPKPPGPFEINYRVPIRPSHLPTRPPHRTN
jgi:hypothetical protein